MESLEKENALLKKSVFDLSTRLSMNATSGAGVCFSRLQFPEDADESAAEVDWSSRLSPPLSPSVSEILETGACSD